MKTIISKGATVTDIRNQALEDGMTRLAHDGVLKILADFTDLQQLCRVIAQEYVLRCY